MTKLTSLSVAKLKPKARRYDVRDSEVGGLRLTVLPSGEKRWSVRYWFNGRDRRIMLGNVENFKNKNGDSVDLNKVRQLARDKIGVVASGVDPQVQKIEARRRAQIGLDRDDLFGAVWDRYLTEYVKPELKASTAGEIERLAKKLILPKFQKRKLSEICAHDVKAMLAAQKKRNAPGQASKVFVTLRAFFNWARGELLLRENPCAGLQKPPEEKPRENVLSDQEIQWFWQACERVGFPFGMIGKLLLLTAARREEIRCMTKFEIDRDNTRLFTLKGTRTKNGKEHAIYLSDASLRVLDDVPKFKNKFGLLFSTNGETPCSGFSRAKRNIDTEMDKLAKAEGKAIKPWVIHDLRRTAATKMAELGIMLPVIERCLNHISGSFAGIVSVYQRYKFEPEMKAAFEKWAAEVERITAVRAVANA